MRRLRDVVGGFQQNNLLTYASAISFQILWALLPFLLFLFAMLGVLHLDSVWEDSLRGEVRDHVSKPAFELIDDTIRRVLSSRELFWVTAGALLAVWEVSGAVRAVMKALDGVYGAKRRRGVREQLLISIALAVGVGLCLLSALAVVRFAPLLSNSSSGLVVEVLVFVGKWGAAVLLLGLAVGLLVRYAPATRQPVSWVSFGSLLVIGSWIVTSVAFTFYLTTLASYGSIFGNLASLFVLITYLYLSSCAFLFGVQVDALVREEVRDSAS